MHLPSQPVLTVPLNGIKYIQTQDTFQPVKLKFCPH